MPTEPTPLRAQQSDPPDVDGRADIDEFVELMSSVPPIAGRMWATLLLTEEASLSSRQLITQLGVSSASVSTMGRLLYRMGVVDRTVSEERRRDLFSIRKDAWVQSMRNTEREIHKIIRWLDRALASIGESSVAGERIEEMRDFYVFYAQEIPQIIERYERWRSARDGDQTTEDGA